MKLVVFFFLFVFVQCSQDSNLTKLTYMPDMAWSPKLKPHRDYLDPPEHSVSHRAIIYPKTAEEAESVFKNPLLLPKEQRLANFTFQKNILEGKERYSDFCTPCHGIKGDGAGTVVGQYPRPPDITKSPYVEREDGFFFYRITFGHTIMPAYGHAITPNERWQIILHLRTLQGKL